MRALLAGSILLVVFAAQFDSGDCIMSLCKKVVAECKLHSPKIKDHLYNTVCSKKCKQPMTVPLIESYLEKSFRLIFKYINENLPSTCKINLSGKISATQLVALAREFERCPKVNHKANLCDWDPKGKDKPVIQEIMSKAIQKGMPLATKLIGDASKCDKCLPLVDKILVDGWNGKGDAPNIKKMIDEAAKMWC